MRRRATTIALLALTLGACDKPTGDETDSALEPGATVVTFGEVDTPLYVPDRKLVGLASGTRLVVVEDPGRWLESENDFAARIARNPDRAEAIRREGPIVAEPGSRYMGEAKAGVRLVRVLVESGAHANEAGRVHRGFVRPLP